MSDHNYLLRIQELLNTLHRYRNHLDPLNKDGYHHNILLFQPLSRHCSCELNVRNEDEHFIISRYFQQPIENILPVTIDESVLTSADVVPPSLVAEVGIFVFLDATVLLAEPM